MMTQNHPPSAPQPSPEEKGPLLPLFKDGEYLAEWRIECKLGEGGFGAVYKVRDRKNQYFAMKTENEKATLRVLKMDVLVLREMGSKSAKHFCRLRDSGNSRGVNYLVMSLVGVSLNDLRRTRKDKHFSLGCALLTGVQSLQAIQGLHSSGFIHRDIKNGNFTIGRNEPKRIFLIDFGMCRKITDKDNAPRKPRWSCGFRGTLPYASISCHISREMCRKDDLESWLYSQVELTNGDLPWRKMEDMDAVLKSKMEVRTGPSMMAFFGGCPKEYVEALHYIDSLRFFEKPNYDKLIDDFKRCIIREKLQDSGYDWEADPLK